jgi:hypothetical protein
LRSDKSIDQNGVCAATNDDAAASSRVTIDDDIIQRNSQSFSHAL